jgi:putative hydrolase of the HAD superfamily
MAAVKYKHIFIDLDKTIWDFDRNARLTFGELFQKYELAKRGVRNTESLFTVFNRYNEMLWDLYRENRIIKEVLNIRRFELTLNEFGIDDLVMATRMAEDYITLSPLKTAIFPHSRPALVYLKEKYRLHLITNGFEEVQHTKLDANDLRKYFTTITTSEEAGVKKPEVGIFELAMRKAGALASESLMIGDDLAVDIAGARNAGMDTLYFNPEKSPHAEEADHEIHSWHEVMEFL